MQLKFFITLSFFFLGIMTSVNAQGLTRTSSFLDKTDFKVGYFGDLFWSNGLNVGAEYLWKEKRIIKERKKGQRIIAYQLLLNGSVGYSTNFSIQTENGLTVYHGVILRRVSHKGNLLNLELNPIGYYRSFLPTTYKVDGDDVSKVWLTGRGYYAPSVAFGIGKYRKGKIGTGWYLNLRYYIRTPFNGGTYSMAALEFGYRFNFKNK